MKSESWFKRADALLAAFFIPVAIMILIFVQRQIFPFGDNSFLRTDMYHQYAPFFSEFQYKLKHGQSLLYSWDIGMGVNFSALYAYYLASPLNWLIVLCPKSLVIEFMTYMIVVKIGLSGLAMTYYLQKHSKKEGMGTAFFGIGYALSGYMAAYSWNIMWLDCIILLPLIALGLERLVNKKKGLMYAICLGLSITSNYYISIMICMFLIFYFVALLVMRGVTSKKDFFIAVLQFGFFSLLAGGISAMVLLPEIFALKATASGTFNFPQVYVAYFSIIDMVARHMPGVETEIGLDHWPNIYCGVGIYLFILLYLMNKKISLKEKAVYFTMSLFFLASFAIDVLNYIWHGFHYPNSLPARQSFIYIFLVLFMAFRAYDKFRANTLKELGMATVGSLGFILLAQKTVEQKHFGFGVYYASLILIAIYALLLYLWKKKRINVNALIIATLVILSVEMTANTGLTSVTTVSRKDYKDDNADVAKVLKDLPNDTFYRFEKVTRKTKDDGAWMNFHSVSLFSSTARAALSDFSKEMGTEASTNAYSITGSTPLVDMLYTVKYGIYTGESKDPNVEYVTHSNNIYLYENPYTLPIGYLVGPGFETSWDRTFRSPADVQNNLTQIIGTSPVLLEEEGEKDGSTYTFTTSEKGRYYVYINDSSIKTVKVKSSKDNIDQTFENVDRGYFIDLGYVDKGITYSVRNDDNKEMDASAYRFDYKALKEAYDMLNISPFTVTHYDSRTVEGTVDAGPEEVLMTSIPYDEGWTVYVDGVKTKPRKGLDTFLALDLTEGKHEIKMKFTPQGLYPGMVISGGSILVLVLIAVFFNRRKKVLDTKEENHQEVLQENAQK